MKHTTAVQSDSVCHICPIFRDFWMQVHVHECLYFLTVPECATEDHFQTVADIFRTIYATDLPLCLISALNFPLSLLSNSRYACCKMAAELRRDRNSCADKLQAPEILKFREGIMRTVNDLFQFVCLPSTSPTGPDPPL